MQWNEHLGHLSCISSQMPKTTPLYLCIISSLDNWPLIYQLVDVFIELFTFSVDELSGEPVSRGHHCGITFILLGNVRCHW